MAESSAFSAVRRFCCAASKPERVVKPESNSCFCRANEAVFCFSTASAEATAAFGGVEIGLSLRGIKPRQHVARRDMLADLGLALDDPA